MYYILCIIDVCMYVCTNNYVHDVLYSVALPVRVNYPSGSTPVNISVCRI